MIICRGKAGNPHVDCTSGAPCLYLAGEGGVCAVTGMDTSLVGRGEELSRLRDLVAPPHAESRVLLILGDPGLGKTVLLAEAAREARLAGMRVLTAAGRESE